MRLTTLSTTAILAFSFTTSSLAFPTPDSNSDSTVVPISWDDVVANIEAGKVDFDSSTSADTSTDTSADVSADVSADTSVDDTDVDTSADDTTDDAPGDTDADADANVNIVNLAARDASPMQRGHRYGGKSGAESGHRGGSGLWGRSPEPEPKKGKGKGHGRVTTEKKIEGANVFDEGGDHREDPSWG